MSADSPMSVSADRPATDAFPEMRAIRARLEDYLFNEDRDGDYEDDADQFATDIATLLHFITTPAPDLPRDACPKCGTIAPHLHVDAKEGVTTHPPETLRAYAHATDSQHIGFALSPESPAADRSALLGQAWVSRVTNAGSPDQFAPPVENSELREADAYLDQALRQFDERDILSLNVHYRVSPKFITAVRSQRAEISRLISERTEIAQEFGVSTDFDLGEHARVVMASLDDFKAELSRLRAIGEVR